MTQFDGWIRHEPAAMPDATAGPATLNVMTYNIRHGRGMDDQIDLRRLADVMANSSAQVIGLQEVDIETERSQHVDQPGTLGELLRMHVVYGPNITYQGGLYGNALLSRHPVSSVRNIPLPAGGRRRWGLLHAEVEVDGTVVHHLVTHLSLEASERLDQLHQILEVVRALQGPVIVMGDLNIVAGTNEDPSNVLSPTLRDVWLQKAEASGDPSTRPEAKHGDGSTAGYTFRSDNPSRRIDYIFINDSLQVAGDRAVYTIESQASDHLPLVAELTIQR